MAKGQSTKGRRGKPLRHSLLEHYRPIDGVVDEMVDADGQSAAGLDALHRRLSRNSGRRSSTSASPAPTSICATPASIYRVYDKAGANERAWPLAHVPLLIDENEWAEISAGLVQRADLLEEIVADIYGDNRLVEQGVLPAGLIAASPEFLRPVVGIKPASGHFLHFCAFELGRGPDGGWWVLGDRTQAPSGAGFALENRVATTRALSDIYGEMHVHRLAGFFRRFRDALNGMAKRATTAASPS